MSSRDKFGGTVFSIRVDQGWGFFKALFAVPKWGYWIKAYSGVRHDSRPALESFIGVPAQFFTFFPLVQAVKRKIVEPIGVIPLEHDEVALPPLKEPGGVMPDGSVSDWIIIDGADTRRARWLSDAEKRFPDKMIVNDTALAEMILDGWRPETSIHVLKSGGGAGA